MPERILLFNVHSYHNAGDAALTEESIRQIQNAFTGWQLSIMMNDPPSYTGSLPVVRSFLSWIVQSPKGRRGRFVWFALMGIISVGLYRLTHKPVSLAGSPEMNKALLEVINADILIGTSGGYYYSYGQGRMFLLQMLTLAIMLISGKPVYLLPQSYGPIRYKREKWLLCWLLPKIRIPMAREAISKQFLISSGVPGERIYLLPDPAMAYTGLPANAAKEWLMDNAINVEIHHPVMGVTIMDWGAQDVTFKHQEKYEDAIVAAIIYFLDKFHGHVVILPQCTGPSRFEDDRIPSRRVASRLDERQDSVHLIDTELTTALLWSLYGQMDLMIGTRMHSNIFALSQFVPAIAVGYLHKTLGIARSLGIEEWVIDIHEINKPLLVNKLDQLWSKSPEVRRHLTQSIPEQVRLCQTIGTIIARDYERFLSNHPSKAD